MGSNIRPRGGHVPDYNAFKWNDFEFSTRPLGLRGSRLLRGLPFLTGRRPRFEVTVKNTLKDERHLVLGDIKEYIPGSSRHKGREDLDIGGNGEQRVVLEADWLAQSGQHRFGARLSFGSEDKVLRPNYI